MNVMGLHDAYEEARRRRIVGWSRNAMWVESRADELLSRLSSEQVSKEIQAIDALFSFWRESRYLENEGARYVNTATGERHIAVFEYETYQSLAAELFDRRTYDDCVKTRLISDTTWSERFAALALAYLAQSTLEGQSIETVDAVRDIVSRLTRSGELMANAHEALGYAVAFIEMEGEAAPALRAARSESARKAGTLRHVRTENLKKEFADFYRSKTFASKAKAAQLFYRQLPPEKKRFLKESNYQRTLVQSLKQS